MRMKFRKYNQRQEWWWAWSLMSMLIALSIGITVVYGPIQARWDRYTDFRTR